MAFNANDPLGSGLVQTFGDEFSSASISSNGAANGTLWNDHIWFHAPRPDLFSVSSGVLNIRTDGNDAWAANIQTTDAQGQGFAQKFGYFEASIKVSGDLGTWPSFWMINNDRLSISPNLPAAELDILEGQGSFRDGYFGTLHYDSAHANAYGQSPNNVMRAGTDLSADFHRYAALWDPTLDHIKFFFDGREVGTAPKFATTDASPMMLILGHGFGDMIGSNYGNPNGSVMQVDWVHAYQFADQHPGQLVGTPVTGISTPSTPTTPSTPMTPSTPAPTGPNVLTLRVSGDKFSGTSPEFQVFVDGAQVGGNYAATATHGTGWSDVSVGGVRADVAHKIEVKFVNDLNGAGGDRNLYVDAITLGGKTYQGEAAANTASLGYGGMDPTAAVMVTNGIATFQTTSPATTTPPTTPPTTAPTTPSTPAPATDVLSLRVSGDKFSGTSPEFQVFVDGAKVGGNYAATATHGTGWNDVSVGGVRADVAHKIEVKFVNDLNGAGGDRNLYVDAITLGGKTYQGEAAANTASLGYGGIDPSAAVMVTNGTATFQTAGSTTTTPTTTTPTTTTPTTTAPAPTITDTLALRVSSDKLSGTSAEFQVFVDGAKVGGNYAATATHGAGWSEVNIGGIRNDAAHDIDVKFVNDLNGPGGDRNLYIEAITLGGKTYQGEAAANNASLGYDAMDPTAAVMVTNGITTFHTTASDYMFH